MNTLLIVMSFQLVYHIFFQRKTKEVYQYVHIQTMKINGDQALVKHHKSHSND